MQASTRDFPNDMTNPITSDPNNPGPRRFVGCVATATSQLLKFWQYPECIAFSSTDEYTDSCGIDFDGDSATARDG